MVMIDVKYNLHLASHQLDAIGRWLDDNMPNPPLPEPQRWSFGYNGYGVSGIQFLDDADATLFLLRWPNGQS